jgi:hypothetical protein
MGRWTEQTIKEVVQMTNKYMKKCSKFLSIKEMQIKMMLRFHLNPVRMAVRKKTNSNCLKRCGGQRREEFLHIVGGNVC